MQSTLSTPDGTFSQKIKTFYPQKILLQLFYNLVEWNLQSKWPRATSSPWHLMIRVFYPLKFARIKCGFWGFLYWESAKTKWLYNQQISNYLVSISNARDVDHLWSGFVHAFKYLTKD